VSHRSDLRYELLMVQKHTLREKREGKEIAKKEREETERQTFGCPVVPEVYMIVARSSPQAGLGTIELTLPCKHER
jgi:hypothetical protein